MSMLYHLLKLLVSFCVIYIESLGLPGAPKIKFVKQANTKNQPRATKEESEEDSDAAPVQPIPVKPKTKIDKMFEKKNTTILSEHYNKLVQDLDQDDEGDLLKLVRKNHDIDESKLPFHGSVRNNLTGQTTKTHKEVLKERRKSKKDVRPSKLLFNDEGEQIEFVSYDAIQDFEKTNSIPALSTEYIQSKTTEMGQSDVLDKRIEKERVKERKRMMRQKERKARQEDSGVQGSVTLGGCSDQDEEEIDFDANASYDEDDNASYVSQEDSFDDQQNSSYGGESSSDEKSHSQKGVAVKRKMESIHASQ